ncbi:MAG: acyl-CoA dehydrogenase family protein, partial [Polaromonas sp.]|nr:acyl-CoA dehydrogenase family protein [Polaromonas sp.]
AIHAYGSEDHRTEWLPSMATGEAIGCFGLTEPDHGSDPAGMRTVAKRDGGDWVLSGTKMWITNGSVADVAVVWAQTEDGIRGFVVPTSTTGFTDNEITSKMSLRASVTSELVLDGVRLPSSAMLPGARGLSGPLGCLSEARFGIVFGTMGADRCEQHHSSASNRARNIYRAYPLSRYWQSDNDYPAGWTRSIYRLCARCFRCCHSGTDSWRNGRTKDGSQHKPSGAATDQQQTGALADTQQIQPLHWGFFTYQHGT